MDNYHSLQSFLNVGLLVCSGLTVIFSIAIYITQGWNNPANREGKPIFPERGSYGQNLLSEDLVDLPKNQSYSLYANLPDNTNLTVQVSILGSRKNGIWMLPMGRGNNWVFNWISDSTQQFDLANVNGDQEIHFSGSGNASITALFKGKVVLEKQIKWDSNED